MPRPSGNAAMMLRRIHAEKTVGKKRALSQRIVSII